MKKIFVQIPAYRDTELAYTLLDLFAKARWPHQLRVAVCWQHSDDEQLPDAIMQHPDIEIVKVPYQKSKGCNWARRKLQRLWNQEPYTLLLDSHHRFVKNWDLQLITMFENLRREGVQKPLLTAYLPPYIPETDPEGREKAPLYIQSLSREMGLLIYLVAFKIPGWRQLRQPVPAKFTSLHFIFADGHFNRDLPFDDSIYFFGDEVVTALRAYSMGYELFHPHRVIGWHLYNRTHTRITHWDDRKDSVKRHRRSHEKIRNIFLGVEEDLLGQVKTIEEYESLIGEKLIEG